MLKVTLTIPPQPGTMPWGKFKGKPFDQVPAKYMLWLFNKDCDDYAVMEYIRQNYKNIIYEISKQK